MKRVVVLNAMLLIMLVCLGCDVGHPTDNAIQQARPEMVAMRTTDGVKIDGRLDEEIWTRAPIYDLVIPAAPQGNDVPVERGQVQLAWDDEFFYLGVKFTDSDVVAEADEDQLHHYRLGDVCEWFIKPANDNYYWELYVTPKGNKTTFFYPSRGRLGLPSSFETSVSGLKVAAHTVGTLNDCTDRDEYWTAEMAMPIADLTAYGYPFSTNSEWHILVARYNFSAYLTTTGPEVSAFAELTARRFHSYEEYARLKLTD